MIKIISIAHYLFGINCVISHVQTRPNTSEHAQTRPNHVAYPQARQKHPNTSESLAYHQKGGGSRESKQLPSSKKKHENNHIWEYILFSLEVKSRLFFI